MCYTGGPHNKEAKGRKTKQGAPATLQGQVENLSSGLCANISGNGLSGWRGCALLYIGVIVDNASLGLSSTKSRV